ncbi:MAG: hypothetical protein WC477_01635 [Patescibacteria group bacterium]
MNLLPRLPDVATATLADFVSFFDELEKRFGIRAFYELFNRAFLRYEGHDLIPFGEGPRFKVEGRRWIAGCIIDRLNDHGKLEPQYYVFFNTNEVEVLFNPNSTVPIKTYPTWEAGARSILGEFNRLFVRLAALSVRSMQFILSTDDVPAKEAMP